MKNHLAVFAVLLAFSSCSSLEVVYDYDKSVDFKQFSTFSFYPWDPKNGYQINDYDKLTIRNALRDAMENRGYTFMKEGGDLIISTFVTLEGKTSYEAYTNHYGGWAGYGGGWGYSGFGYAYGYGPGYSQTTVTERNYNQGTLIVDVFSTAGKKLVWQGIGSREVEYDLDARDKKLPKNVAEIMSHFPARQKK